MSGTPPKANVNANNAAAATPTTTGSPPNTDWRKSVLQSYRSSEVREISKVLAALEGSASVTPASKLMLAMRFEDQIFKSAKDLADYRKKISKRLKKLKKNYVRPAAKVAPAAAKGPGGATLPEDNTEAKEELAAKLKRDFGDKIKYIVENAAAAVADLKRKLGPEKSRQLQQHTDSCRMWARDLGILTEDELIAIAPKPVVAAAVEAPVKNENENPKTAEDANKTSDSDSKQPQPQQGQPQSQSSQPPSQTQPPKPPEPAKKPEMPKPMSNKKSPMSLSQLQRIEKHLNTRVGNIRSYVVKHADPDQFLLETLQMRDVAFSKNVAAGNAFRDVLKGRVSSQREQLQKATASDPSKSRTIQEDKPPSGDQDDDPLLVLQKALEKAMAAVPQATRHDSKKLEASLRHLDKMRAASTTMMTYWTLDGDQRVETAPRDTLKKIHDVVQDGADFVIEAVKELGKQTTQSPGSGGAEATHKVLSLQDAWSKSIELPSAEVAPAIVEDEENNSSNSNSNDSNSNKRPRTNSYKPYYKARMLFKPNRKTPQPLLMAIRRKGARIQAASAFNSNAVHLVLDFESAFCMTIYFSPLTAVLRAKTPNENEIDNGNSSSASSSAIRSSALWKPLSHGLTPWGSTLDSSDFRRKKEAQNNTNTNTNSNPNNPQQQQHQQQLSVWGVTAGYESIGRVVEERLRDASTHATAILRRCFRNHVKNNVLDFEVELLEGSALLEFLQLARSTYMPHWEDVDVDV